ncbi:hypothetical protein JEQ12_014942 [Ovis aries]|uniref:Taste receptor type 2 n=1 Tax=Ovis aries TaxID=9940 RepID=A0A836D4N5_SHEEP|nr:hypothetical protein JEQ12_014942 [Ovis aries]
MITLLSTIFSILVIIQFILRNFANGFLALVSCIDWVKRQKISSIDVIVTAMAVSRIVLLCVMLIHWYYVLLHPALYGFKIRTIVHVAWTISNHYSTWLATSLSIFYFHFSSLIFLHPKWRVKSVALMMMLGTSLILFIQVAVLSIGEAIQIKEYEGNATQKTKLRDILHLSNVTLFTLTNFIPFSMSLTSFLLLIFSLWKHLRKMQLNDPSSKAHVRAMIMAMPFLILLAIHFLSHLMTTFHHNVMQSELAFMLAEALGTIYPSVHSFVLILGNDKLRKASLLVLWQLRCG